MVCMDPHLFVCRLLSETCQHQKHALHLHLHFALYLFKHSKMSRQVSKLCSSSELMYIPYTYTYMQPHTHAYRHTYIYIHAYIRTYIHDTYIHDTYIHEWDILSESLDTAAASLCDACWCSECVWEAPFVPVWDTMCEYVWKPWLTCACWSIHKQVKLHKWIQLCINPINCHTYIPKTHVHKYHIEAI